MANFPWFPRFPVVLPQRQRGSDVSTPLEAALLAPQYRRCWKSCYVFFYEGFCLKIREFQTKKAHPDAQWRVYLPTVTPKTTQMYISIYAIH